MNNNHLKIEEEYINNLKNEMEKTGLKDENLENTLKQIKENNKIFQGINDLNKKEMIKLDDNQLARKLGLQIPNYKAVEG